jgi:hypothetical protein
MSKGSQKKMFIVIKKLVYMLLLIIPKGTGNRLPFATPPKGI